MQFDWRWFFACILCGLIISMLHSLRRRIKRDESQIRVWECCRYQGGGKILTPPLTETAAIEFASALGSILWIDRERGFIFYRSSH